MQEFEQTPEDRLLEALGLPTKRDIAIARGVGSEGSIAPIENKLQILLSDIRGGKIKLENIAEEFLSESCIELWRQAQDIKPILYLYDKYWDVPYVRDSTEDVSGLSIGFPGVMATIAAEVDEEDRSSIIEHAVRFIFKHDIKLDRRLIKLLGFAADLTGEGLEKEGETIARALARHYSHMILEEPFMLDLFNEAVGLSHEETE